MPVSRSSARGSRRRWGVKWAFIRRFLGAISRSLLVDGDAHLLKIALKESAIAYVLPRDIG
jgi:hypothetical protein